MIPKSLKFSHWLSEILRLSFELSFTVIHDFFNLPSLDLKQHVQPRFHCFTIKKMGKICLRPFGPARSNIEVFSMQLLQDQLGKGVTWRMGSQDLQVVFNYGDRKSPK